MINFIFIFVKNDYLIICFGLMVQKLKIKKQKMSTVKELREKQSKNKNKMSKTTNEKSLTDRRRGLLSVVKVLSMLAKLRESDYLDGEGKGLNSPLKKESPNKRNASVNKSKIVDSKIETVKYNSSRRNNEISVHNSKINYENQDTNLDEVIKHVERQINEHQFEIKMLMSNLGFLMMSKQNIKDKEEDKEENREENKKENEEGNNEVKIEEVKIEEETF